MVVSRQHDSTTIPELVGARIREWIGVGRLADNRFLFFYMLADSTWYRFFIHCETLFWTTAEPDPEDDLEEGENYRDFAAEAGISLGSAIERIEMHDGCLEVQLTPKCVVRIVVDVEFEAMVGDVCR